MLPLREPLLVVGAGLGGLTAALALARGGWRVEVCEQARVLGEIGAGLTLSAGACRGLASLGLESDLLAASDPVPDIAFLHYRSGELLAGTLRPETRADPGLGVPRHIHRADLHAILRHALELAAPSSLETGRGLVGAEPCCAGMRARFADGSARDTPLMIGADGVRSATRLALFGEAPPHFAGQVAFRCLIPAAVAGPLLRGIGAAVFVGNARVFNRYLVRRQTLINVVGIARSDRWREDGWNTPATSAEFLEEFAEFHPDVRALIASAPSDSLIKWGLCVRAPLPRWGRGAAILIGDAAHPVLPFLGLGAALAIEDGIVLARAVAMAADFASVAEVFQRARFARVEEVRSLSLRQGDIVQASDPDRGSLGQSPSQRPALYDYDPCSVPLTMHSP
jgi:salicylate hydroxylase